MNSASLSRRFALLALAAGLLTSPTRAQDVAADTVINAPKPANVRIYPDLAYLQGGSPRQKLDIYLPSPVPADPLPLIVYLHGGGWKKGSKADGRRFAFRMVAQGYAVACVGYRLSDEELFPAQLEDCKAAVRWLRDNAPRYRIDPEHVGVMGVSAGGFLAVMMGVTRSTQLFDVGEHLGQASGVQGVCDFFGPTDLVQLHEYSSQARTPQAEEIVKLLGGDPHIQKIQARKSNPLTYLDGVAPPFLLVQGANDTVIPPAQSRQLYEALKKQAIPVHLHLVNDAGHTGPAFVAPDINALVDTFFIRTLKPGRLEQEKVPAYVTESTAAKN